MKSRVSGILVVCLILCSFVLSCSKPKYVPPSPPIPGLKSQKPYQIRGIGTTPAHGGWIRRGGHCELVGADFHGKPTACGERYDNVGMTAAHKTLPLGSTVKVTNLKNQHSIVLRINDRGPFVSGRIIRFVVQGGPGPRLLRPGDGPVRVEAVQVASEYKIGQDTYWKVDPPPSFRYGHFYDTDRCFPRPGQCHKAEGPHGRGEYGGKDQPGIR